MSPIDRRRHEDRDAEGAKTSGVWGGGAPLPSPENFSFLSSKRRVLMHSETGKTYF